MTIHDVFRQTPYEPHFDKGHFIKAIEDKMVETATAWEKSRQRELARDGRGVMRYFETGATRDTDETKPDYEGFTSPLVTKAFGAYMTRHRQQADGKLRDSDNWQKGIPREAYIKSAARHFEDWRLHHDGFPEEAVEPLLDALMALKFNVEGYAFEILKARQAAASSCAESAIATPQQTPPSRAE